MPIENETIASIINDMNALVSRIDRELDYRGKAFNTVRQLMIASINALQCQRHRD
jgi:hypothetical protein